MGIQSKEKEIRVIWSLTELEKITLRNLILGYGNLQKAADKAKLSRITLYRIALTGRGYKRNIQKIRSKLLQTLATA